MCYELIISTNSPDDLSRLNQPNVYFEPLEKKDYCHNLCYPKQYRIATMHPNSCSCALRVFVYDLAKNFSFKFMPYQDWYENIDEDFDNAKFLFQVFKNIVIEGYQIDSYLAWNGDENLKPLQFIHVNIHHTLKEHFAFFENVYFNYEK